MKEDCLIVEKWPENVTMNKSRVEVVVDVLCATAVLRGAHVFAPGVLGLPSSMYIKLSIIMSMYQLTQCIHSALLVGLEMIATFQSLSFDE